VGKVQPGRAVDHSLPSIAAVMEEYSYTSTHPLGHTGPVKGSLYFASPELNYYYYILLNYDLNKRHAMAQLVEALRYKPQGRLFDSRWYHFNFSLT